jgi:hypothetical protein
MALLGIEAAPMMQSDCLPAKWHDKLTALMWRKGRVSTGAPTSADSFNVQGDVHGTT